MRYRLWLGLVLLTGGPVRASTNNLVVNGSFEAGTASWQTPGSPSVTYTAINTAVHGALGLRVSNRGTLTQCPAQTITAALTNEGSGVPVGVSFAVNLSAPAHVRCYVQLNTSTSTQAVILAEQTIDATNGWTRLEGAQVLSWPGALSLASVRFVIGQITEGVAPTFVLDDVRIIRDSDRDGLTDDIDPFTASADANGNQIPDGWDSRYVLTNFTAFADADGDGYTDVQEYWAASDPTNALVYPAMPVNANATPEARAVLKYLALLPSHASNRVVVGQVVTDTPYDYTNQVAALAAQTGKWPGMLGLVYDMIQGPINWPVINPHGSNYWNDGGLIHIQWNPDNPWTGGFSGDTNGINFTTLFTPGTPAHSNYVAYLDEVALGLRSLGDAGCVVLFRPLNECNSYQNWYQQRARTDYVKLYRWTHDYLAHTQALHHVLWVYDALAAPHQQVPVTYYYPGNDVVDVFGVNVYDDDWNLPFDLDRFSRDVGKVLGIPECGPFSIIDGTFSNTTYIAGITNHFPRLSYFAPYNSFTNATFTRYSLIDNLDAAGLLNHPWIVTLDEVAWTDYLPGIEPTLAGNQLTLDWGGIQLQTSTDLVTWATITNAPRPYVEDVGNLPKKFYRARR